MLVCGADPCLVSFVKIFGHVSTIFLHVLVPVLIEFGGLCRAIGSILAID